MRKATNGDVYKGNWVDGRLQGEGEYETQSGLFKGTFHRNKEHGFGTKIFPDTSVYTGEWKEGLPQGKGELKLPNGDIYFGDFLNGKREGKGTLKYANGNMYEGEWQDDIQNGIGKFSLPKKLMSSPFPNEYIGNFKDN